MMARAWRAGRGLALRRVLARLRHAAGLPAALLAAALFAGTPAARAQDYAREARWNDSTLSTLDDGEAVWLTQAKGHRFLGLWLPAEQMQPGTKARGAVLLIHGRGWAPNVELYGALRTQIAAAGWSTLAIQMPVLDGTGKVGDYVFLYPDAIERIRLAVDWLKARGFDHVAIVSHSLGATMANQYLIRTSDGKVGAWAFLSILNGLEDMFRIQIPVLDVYADRDWEVIRYGADERRKQITRIPGSAQIELKDSEHFFEGHWPELTRVVVGFLDRAFEGR